MLIQVNGMIWIQITNGLTIISIHPIHKHQCLLSPRINFTASYWVLPRYFMQPLTALIACEMLGLVQTTIDIMISITLEEGTHNICCYSTSIFGGNIWETLKCAAKGTNSAEHRAKGTTIFSIHLWETTNYGIWYWLSATAELLSYTTTTGLTQLTVGGVLLA